MLATVKAQLRSQGTAAAAPPSTRRTTAARHEQRPQNHD